MEKFKRKNGRWRMRDKLVANMFGFKPEDDFFSVPPSVQEVPNVDFAAT
jgi:hypothetical protein